MQKLVSSLILPHVTLGNQIYKRCISDGVGRAVADSIKLNVSLFSDFAVKLGCLLHIENIYCYRNDLA